MENKIKNPLLGNSKYWFLSFVFITNLLIVVSVSNTSFAQNKIKRSGPTSIVPSLNAYSFNKILLSKDEEGNPKFTLFDLLDWCAEQNIKAIDVTGYYFPAYPEVPSDDYLFAFKQKAFLLGIDISGTGIRNDFASPDPEVRQEGVELAKKWIVVASRLGAPVIRLFAGKIPEGYENKWDEVAEWMIPCFKECAEFGEKHGVMIGIQNHGDMIQTSEQCLKVLKAVDSKWAGIILDTGMFKTKDPYEDIKAVTPFAVNWQVKESVFGKESEIRTDFSKIVEILRENNYRGYLPVETLENKNKAYDPFVLVPEMITELNNALK
ncbi:sugar phosphate isomerase/epimerase family protein [uncultured Draconibacterium sp.]|uniref:sugar phosphate isomerase/epimerase family protein n=1 Tax=uncultured Draconibacterium sp. TaxID=1573823 RepID=UPI0025E54747|nr:sugar phosphate isomerase/epimerase family protein [uncultured Draconibacterium sp.]